MFSLDEHLTPAMLTSARSVISASALAAVVVFGRRRLPANGSDRQQPNDSSAQSSEGSTVEPAAGLQLQVSSDKIESDAAQSTGPAAAVAASTQTPGMPTAAAHGQSNEAAVPLKALLLAGFEIGLWNFLGTACQAQGLETTGATKAAFLGQASQRRALLVLICLCSAAIKSTMLHMTLH